MIVTYPANPAGSPLFRVLVRLWDLNVSEYYRLPVHK